MFVSVTSWLPRYYQPDEAAPVQSFNDFCVFTVVALSCLLEPKVSLLTDKTTGFAVDNQAGELGGLIMEPVSAL